MTATTEFFEAIRSGDVAAVDEHLRGDATLATARNESGIVTRAGFLSGNQAVSRPRISTWSVGER